MILSRPDHSAVKLPAEPASSNARIQGINVGSRDLFEDMCRAIGQHHLHPVIDRSFPFERADEAFSMLRAGGHFGKLVIQGV